MKRLAQWLRDKFTQFRWWLYSQPSWIRKLLWFGQLVWEIVTFFIQIWLFGLVWGTLLDIITTWITLAIVYWLTHIPGQTDTERIMNAYPPEAFAPGVVA